MLRRTLLLGALASVALFVAGTNARASYTFTTAVTASGGTFTGGISNTITPNSGSSASDGPGSVLFLTVSYTGIPAGATTATGLQTINWTETLSSVTIPGTPATFNLSAVLNFTGTGGGVQATLVSITPGSSVNGFTLSNGQYTAGPSPSNSPGQIGYTVQGPVGVPEPASVVMLGSGLVGIIGLGFARNRRKNAETRLSANCNNTA